jgi:hypothetical protein
MKLRLFSVVSGLAALAAFSACSGSGPTAPDAGPAAVAPRFDEGGGGGTTQVDTTQLERGGVGTLGSGN